MNWILLLLAGIFETAFAICLGKARHAESGQAWWYTGFVVFLTASMILLMLATRTIPIGTAYAVWTGIGAAGAILAGIFLFDEPAAFWRLFFLVTLVASLIGLKVVSD